MIARFFRHLEQHGVEWLLVSGQATILYGAANFSEDVDLWVAPEAANLERFIRALHASEASYYKLTPPLTEEHARRHHGFHFTVPDVDGGVALYLDVMGYPPRVGSFPEARQRARVFQTHWGSLPTVAIPELVEMKKTQRPRDYPIIGRLVLAFVADNAELSEEDLHWVVANVFGLSELKQLITAHASVAQAISDRASSFDALLVQAVTALRASLTLPAGLEDDLEAYFDARVAVLRKADRHFWRGVIDELRELRREGKLLPEGAKV